MAKEVASDPDMVERAYLLAQNNAPWSEHLSNWLRLIGGRVTRLEWICTNKGTSEVSVTTFKDSTKISMSRFLHDEGDKVSLKIARVKED